MNPPMTISPFSMFPPCYFDPRFLAAYQLQMQSMNAFAQQPLNAPLKSTGEVCQNTKDMERTFAAALSSAERGICILHLINK